MSAQRPKTETKSSWAKRGPDNKTILYLLAFLPFCLLCVRYWITLTHTEKEGREEGVCVCVCIWFILPLVCGGKEASQKLNPGFLATVPSWGSRSRAHRQSDVCKCFILYAQTLNNGSDEVYSSEASDIPALCFNGDSLWTQGQGQRGRKSLRINAWQWKCSCSWKSAGTDAHIPDSRHTTHTHTHIYTHTHTLLHSS